MDINIPSQVKTHANAGAFPPTGSVKTIYIAEDTNIAYYWTGSAYQPISIQDLSGFQTTPIVVNSNITAQNDRVYHVVANATFTDPTPVEGRGYFVVVRFASSCVLGANSYISGETIHRIFHSGSWLNIALRPSTYVPQSRTINGLDLTANRTLTASDVGAPSGSGTSTGTNTGDETNITILSKLNFFEYKNSANGTAVTGTTAEVIVDSILIPAGTFSSGSGFLDVIFKADKSGANAGWGMRLYIGPNNNNLTGATRIAVNGLNTATSYAPIRRIFDTTPTQLKGFPFSAQAITDDNSSTTAKSTLTVDWTINQYLMPILILTSSSDSCNFSSIHIKNF